MTSVIEDMQLDFDDVLIRPNRSYLESRKDVNLLRHYRYNTIEGSFDILGTGIMSANMGTVGTFKIAQHMLDKGLFATLHKHYSVDDLIEFYSCDDPVLQEIRAARVFFSIGLREEDFNKLLEVRNKIRCKDLSICIDVPNGYINKILPFIRKVREEFPKSLIMAGNVVTPEVVEDIIKAGANIVKIGIGGGSQCITRRQTGVGRPQLSTVLECASAAHRLGAYVCSDGGIVHPGDVCKAFAAGADFVMLGGYYAGTDEADSEIIIKISKPYYTLEPAKNETIITYVNDTIYKVVKEEKFKKSWGMSSELAQQLYYGGLASYRASEGRVVDVPYRGPIDQRNDEILGGLRSMMTYIGASNLEDIPKCSVFYKVKHQLNTSLGD